MYSIHLIAAARPNFMKVAPLFHALKSQSDLKPYLIHTGQHYDANMSDSFFRDLQLPEPDFHLGVGSGSHAEQTGKTLIEYEKICRDNRPDLVIVVGDVNATLACSLAAVKLGIRVAHLEAGLRSFDRTMPEEINRLATDAIVDLLWTPSADGDEHLLKEGVAREKIVRVGNIMIDSFEMLRRKISDDKTREKLELAPESYVLTTLHRPSNVDNPQILSALVESLVALSTKLKVVFPVHPRTRKELAKSSLLAQMEQAPGVRLLEPLSYVEFMNLLISCRFVLTDSGGVQEETSYLGIPCLTLRENTERPITLTQGTNRLCNLTSLNGEIERVLREPSRKSTKIEMWDGQTALRVVESIRKFLAR